MFIALRAESGWKPLLLGCRAFYLLRVIADVLREFFRESGLRTMWSKDSFHKEPAVPSRRLIALAVYDFQECTISDSSRPSSAATSA